MLLVTGMVESLIISETKPEDLAKELRARNLHGAESERHVVVLPDDQWPATGLRVVSETGRMLQFFVTEEFANRAIANYARANLYPSVYKKGQILHASPN